MSEIPILSIALLIPLLSAIYILICCGSESRCHIKWISIASGVVSLLLSALILSQFDYANSDFQFVERYTLIERFGFEFFVGVDGMSLMLISLMSFLSLLSIMSALHTVKNNVKEFICLLLILQALVIGSFAALNLLLFYVFFEMTLVPMYMLIGIWGGDNRINAAYKFFLYTLVGSVIFLICTMYLYSIANTLSIPDLHDIGMTIILNKQKWLWIGIFIAFAIKIPMFPVHTWLPDAHVQAPTTGSVVLAGVLLKLGGYGFLRILLPILPLASIEFAIYPLILSVIAIIYASFVAMAQKDMKKMIAYSSISHMGYVTAGIFSLNSLGVQGSIFQMLSHGLISAALFFTVGSLYERLHTKQIESFGGIAAKMPKLAFFFMIFTLASIGLPGTSGFIGEFLCLNGIFAKHHFIGAISVIGVLLSAIYMLQLYKKTMFGIIINPNINLVSDLNMNERIIFTVLATMIIFLGIFTNLVNELIGQSVQTITKVYNVR